MKRRCCRKLHEAGGGFTLIELLVAMAIVAVIGIMALTGLSTVIDQQEIATARAERWEEIQLAMRIVAQDLAQAHPRPTRDETGSGYRPSFFASPTGQFALEFSRGGWTNPAGFPRGTVLRVAYDTEEDTLVRFYWPVADRTLATPPIRTELLTGVTSVQVRFMDAGGQWHLDWPPIGASGPSIYTSRPRAVEFGVELEDFGEIWRLVETSN
jgi:general secretion pathway protein J